MEKMNATERISVMSYKDTKNISDSDLRPLYESVGWVSYTEKFTDLSVLIANSYQVISAWDGIVLTGLIRTVGDGLSIQYVQDLLVLPKYQNCGIGTELMKRIMDTSTHIRQFVLITDGQEENKAAVEFYMKMGLKTFEETKTCGLQAKT